MILFIVQLVVKHENIGLFSISITDITDVNKSITGPDCNGIIDRSVNVSQPFCSFDLL